MCKYCGDEGRLMCVDDFGACKLEVFIENGKKLAFNAYNPRSNATVDIFGSWKINFCPMCGKKLK